MSANDRTRDEGSITQSAAKLLALLPVVVLVGSALGKIMSAPPVVEQLTTKLGFDAARVPALGVLELVCAIVYAIPQTSFLGAILLTGYFGGAVCAHVRVSDAYTGPLVLGVMVWVGLFARDERVRGLFSLRR